MTTYESMLIWCRTNSGLISIAGALIIFFSWVIANTLGQRYSRMKAATESAQATFRLYTTLHEQRGQLNSLAMEVIQRSEAGLDASALSPGRTENTLVNQARKEYSLTRLSAHQVRELMDFTAETYSLSRAVSKPSSTSVEIEALMKEVENLSAILRRHERDAEQAVNSSQLAPDQLQLAIQSYSDYFRSEALPRVPGLYDRIVTASNTRRDEASEYLDTAKKQAERAGAISIFLYVVGSCLALAGQAIEKTKPKDQPTQQQQAFSDATTANHALQRTGAAVTPAAPIPPPSPVPPSSGRASGTGR